MASADAYKQRHASFLKATATYSFEKSQFDIAASGFLAALILDPNSEELSNLVLLSYARNNRFQEILNFCEDHAEVLARDLSLRAYVPFALGRLEKNQEAMEAYAALFKEGHSAREDITDCLSLFYQADRFREARGLLQLLLKNSPAMWLHVAYANTLGREEKHNEAISYLTALEVDGEEDEFQRELAVVRENNKAERFEVASALADELIKKGRHSGEVHFEKGVAENGCPNIIEAKRSFELALDSDPKNENYQSWLDHVVAQLGQGDTQAIRHPIEPIELPASYFPPEEIVSSYEDEDLLTLEDLTAIRFSRDRGVKETIRHRLLIQNKQGISKLKLYSIAFDPQRCKIFINKCVVTAVDGSIAFSGAIEDYYVKDGDGESGDSGKVVNIPISTVDIGSTLEIVYTKESQGSLRIFPLRLCPLFGNAVALRSAVEVSGDIQNMRHRVFGDVVVNAKPGKIRFVAEESAASVFAPCAAESWKWQPMVQLGETEMSWTEICVEYLDLIDERLAIEPSTKKLAESLTQSCHSDEERTTALITYVRESLQYRSLPFGPRAYIPDPASMVLKSQFSDCKGHSIALNHLMRSLGLPCHLALIDTEIPAWEEVPSRSQFNHMINYLPEYLGGRFVDCVRKHTPAQTKVPEDLQLRGALIVARETQGLRQLPDYDPKLHKMIFEKDIRCFENGSIQVHEHIEMTGLGASYFRSWLADLNEQERFDGLNAVLTQENSQAKLVAFNLPEADDFNRPFTVDMEYMIDGVLHEIDSHLVGILTPTWEHTYLNSAQMRKRVSPMSLQIPLDMSCDTKITCPDGYVGEVKRQGQDDCQGMFFQRQTECLCADNGMHMKKYVIRSRGEFSAKDYDVFIQEEKDTVQSLTTKIVFNRLG